MADTQFPPSIQGAGTIKVVMVPTLVNPLTPTITVLNGSSAFDLTQYFRAEAFQIGMSQAKIDDTRLGDETTRENFGIASFTMDDGLRYIHNPQAAPDSETNIAYQELFEGRTVYFAIRFGTKALLSGAALASGQRIQLWQASLGVQHQSVPVGDNAIHVINQPVTLTRILKDYTLAS